MDKRSNVLVIILFILIVLGMFVFAYMKSNELQAPSVTPDADQTINEVPIVTSDRITAKHYFDNNEHVFAGVIDMPTPCDLLTVDVRVAESFPEQIFLEFKTINNAETCASVITPQRFLSTPVSASEEATVSATLNGKAIELNLIPAGAGEKPEEFELYQKG